MLLYIKFFEEKELLERFGKSYQVYMDLSSFFFPKFR